MALIVAALTQEKEASAFDYLVEPRETWSKYQMEYFKSLNAFNK